MPSCSIIACDHGFGHTRRSMLLANELGRSGWSVDLFAEPDTCGKFMKLYGRRQGVNAIAFSTRTNSGDYKNGNPFKWHENLQDMDLYDLVVSDNLPEILYIRPDAILCGSFLWHKAVEDVDRELFKATEMLLLRNKPVMISSELFAGPELYELTNLHPVGLYVPDLENRDKSSGNDLLIACGGSGVFQDEFENLVNYILENCEKPPFDRVWVDPSLLPAGAPQWMQKAGFDHSMYSGLKAAICRPGVGTLTDCLWCGVPVFCSFEPDNNEMIQNAEMMRQKKVGDYFSTPVEAYHSVLKYISNEMNRKDYLNNLNKINFNGVSETVEILQRYLMNSKN